MNRGTERNRTSRFGGKIRLASFTEPATNPHIEVYIIPSDCQGKTYFCCSLHNQAYSIMIDCQIKIGLLILFSIFSRSPKVISLLTKVITRSFSFSLMSAILSIPSGYLYTIWCLPFWQSPNFSLLRTCHFGSHAFLFTPKSLLFRWQSTLARCRV